MNLDLPEELAMLKKTVRRFVDREPIPIERETCEGGKIKPDVRVAWARRNAASSWARAARTRRTNRPPL